MEITFIELFLAVFLGTLLTLAALIGILIWMTLRLGSLSEKVKRLQEKRQTSKH